MIEAFMEDVSMTQRPGGIKTIEQCWDELAEQIFEGGEPEVQQNEMRNAFYAGVATMAGITQRIAQPDFSEAEAIDAINDVLAELAEFGVSFSGQQMME